MIGKLAIAWISIGPKELVAPMSSRTLLVRKYPLAGMLTVRVAVIVPLLVAPPWRETRVTDVEELLGFTITRVE
ncbi:MAG: hypothetical protein DMG05_27870 [Acidobacteria bacterium]|nr:MAG: hypothetical protein DMG05_27870 [Acidobacteriota bacterium]